MKGKRLISSENICYFYAQLRKKKGTSKKHEYIEE